MTLMSLVSSCCHSHGAKASILLQNGFYLESVDTLKQTPDVQDA